MELLVGLLLAKKHKSDGIPRSGLRGLNVRSASHEYHQQGHWLVNLLAVNTFRRRLHHSTNLRDKDSCIHTNVSGLFCDAG